MISLRVAILFALSTQLISNAVYGYIVVPVSSDDNPSSSPDDNPSSSPDDESSCSLCSANAEETTSAPLLTQNAQAYTASYATVQQNLNAPNRTSKRFPCGENGCYIRHFRQYNYYYPNGQRLTFPGQSSGYIQSQNILTNNGNPISSSIQMTNDNGKMTVQTSNSKPTVRYNLPGVASFVPNNGFNYVYNQFDSGLRSAAQAQAQAQSYAGSSSYDQRPVSGEEQVLSEELSAEQTTTELPPQDDVSYTQAIPTEDENIERDTTTYISGPNMFGQSRMRVVKNGNNRNFQSQLVSMSSGVQSRPQSQSIAEEEQEVVQTISQPLPTPSIGYGNFGSNFQSQQVKISSGTQSKPLPAHPAPATPPASQDEVISSITSNTPTPMPLKPTIFPAFGTGITYPNRLTYGYNPYFQFHQFGVTTLPPTPAVLPPPLPAPVPVAGLPVRSPIYGANNFQFINPVNAWTNYAVQSPLYDITDVAPSYSVVL